MFIRSIAAISACLFLSVGCSAGQTPSSQAPSPTTAASVTATVSTPSGPSATEMSVCTNEGLGYVISYPKDWFTTQNNESNRCRWFDPERFEVADASEAPVVALDVKAEEGVSFRDARKSFGSSGTRIIAISETKVAGRDAYEFETELTEDRLYPKGTRTYGFLVDNKGEAFLVTTTKLADSKAPYEQNKEFVRKAAATLAFL